MISARMRGLDSSGIRIGALVAAVVAVGLLLSACGGSAKEPEGLNASDSGPATTPAETPSENPDVAQLKELYAKYWDAYGKAASGPKTEPKLFEGVTTRDFTEEKLSEIGQFVERNHRLVGQAKLSQVTVTLNGDSAQVEACLDTSEWKIIENGKTIQSDFGDPAPVVLSAKRSDEGWLFDDSKPTKEATIAC